MTLSTLSRLVSDLADAAYFMLSMGDVVGYDRAMARASSIATHYKHMIPVTK